MKLRELVTASAGSVVATAVDMSALVLLVQHGAPIAVSTFVAASAGAVTCFALNKRVAFRDRTRTSLAQVARFALVAVATALLLALAMELVAVKLGVPYIAAKLACSALVFTAWSYPAQRRLVFARVPKELPC
jgi:putative flippase GtrA